jgi:hypothetical protein
MMFQYKPNDMTAGMLIEGDNSYADAVVAAARLPRPKRDIALLDLSIEKWRSIHDILLAHPTMLLDDGGRNTCALCHAFWPDCEERHCPIAVHTGNGGCDNTPYQDYENAYFQGCSATARQAALAESTFLHEVKQGLEDRIAQRRKQMLRTGFSSVLSLIIAALAFSGGGVEGPVVLEAAGLFFLIGGLVLAALTLAIWNTDRQLRGD